MTTTWHGWFGLGGSIKDAPSVVNPTPQTIDVYARGMDDRLWQKWWDWQKWNPSDSGWMMHDAARSAQVTIRRLLHHTSDILDLYGGDGFNALLSKGPLAAKGSSCQTEERSRRVEEEPRRADD